MTIKEKADKLLCETGLLSVLRTYGEPHPIGSYRMDMMVYNDLDIDIRNDSMVIGFNSFSVSSYRLKRSKTTL